MRLGRIAMLACAAGLLLSPGAALAGFSSTTLEVSGDFTNDVFPATTTATDGQSLVVWKESVSGGSSLLRFRRIRPDGTMGPTTTLSDGTKIIVQRDVEFAPGGRALVIWTESTNGVAPLFLRGRWIELDDSLGAQIAIRDAAAGTVSVDEPALTTTSDGDAVVTWRNPLSTPASKVEARRVDANDTLGTLLQPPDGPNQSSVAIAPTPAGGALLAWRAPPGIAAMPVTAAGAAGTVTTPVTADVLGAPRLSSAGTGTSHLLWPSAAPATPFAGLRLDAAGAAIGSPVLVSGESIAFFTQVTNALDRSLAFFTPASAVVGARYIGADGVPEATTFTAPATPLVQATGDVGLTGDGTGVLLWTQGPMGGARGLVGRVIAPDGVAGAPTPLAPFADQVSFDVSSDGVGLVAWQDRANALSGPVRVRVRQFLPLPACSDATGTVVQGAPTTIALRCTGLQIGTPEVLSRPANGTLSAVDPATASVVYTPRAGFAGTDSFTFRGTNPGGVGATRTALIQVGKDTVAPRLTKFRLSIARLNLKRSFRGALARRPAFTLKSSEPVQASVTVKRKRRGTFRAFRTLVNATPATTISLRLAKPGLVPGAYRATVVVTDLAGNRSAPRTIGFVVVKK